MLKNFWFSVINYEHVLNWQDSGNTAALFFLRSRSRCISAPSAQSAPFPNWLSLTRSGSLYVSNRQQIFIVHTWNLVYSTFNNIPDLGLRTFFCTDQAKWKIPYLTSLPFTVHANAHSVSSCILWDLSAFWMCTNSSEMYCAAVIR